MIAPTPSTACRRGAAGRLKYDAKHPSAQGIGPGDRTALWNLLLLVLAVLAGAQTLWAMPTARDGSGLATSTRMGNNTVLAHTWEAGRALPLGTTATRPDATTPHWSLKLRHGPRGELERMDRPHGERALYGHDPLGRLTSATYSGGGSGVDGTEPTYVWEHGLDGRRLAWRHQLGKDTVLYAPGSGMPVEHRLAEGLVKKIEYDYRGNRSVVRTYANVQAAQIAEALGATADTLWLRDERMDFDSRDGLRGYTRITRSVDGRLDTLVRHYVLDERGWRIAELDGDSTVLKRWIYRGNYVAADSGTTDGPGDASGWRVYNGLGGQPQAVAYVNGLGELEGRWYLTDHLGSVTAVEDSAGTRVLTMALDPWGNLEVAKGSEGVGYAYTGKQLDGVLGGSEHGARVLDNRMGMWWGRDRAKQFWNPFSFPSSPLSSIDPDGMEIGVAENENGGLQKITFTADVYFDDDIATGTTQKNLREATLKNLSERIKTAWGVLTDEGVEVKLREISSLSERKKGNHLIRIGNVVYGDRGERTPFAGLVNKIGGMEVQLNWHYVKPSYTPVPNGFPDEGMLPQTIEHEFGHLLGFFHNEDPHRGWTSLLVNEIMDKGIRPNYQMDPKRGNEIIKNFKGGKINVP